GIQDGARRSAVDHYYQRIPISRFIVMRVIENPFDFLIESTLPADHFGLGDRSVLEGLRYSANRSRPFKTIAVEPRPIPTRRRAGRRVSVEDRAIVLTDFEIEDVIGMIARETLLLPGISRVDVAGRLERCPIGQQAHEPISGYVQTGHGRTVF